MYLVGKVSVRNLSGWEMFVGEVSVGDVFGWGNVGWGSFRSGCLVG